jgi:hypothetical protein
VQDGVVQTVGYADQCGADEMYLLIFDRRSDVAWDIKIWDREERWQGQSVGVFGV